MLNRIRNYNWKLYKIKIIRITLQIIFLILFPGLFSLIFSEIKNVYLKIIEGNFNFVQMYPNLIEIITIAIITIFLGRFFCGFICAFGTLNDLIYLSIKKVFKINFKLDRQADSILKYAKYMILMLIIIFSWTMKSKIFKISNPWEAFAGIIEFWSINSSLILGFIILVFILIGSALIERFFCRYLCPLGALFVLSSKIAPFRISKLKERCGSCRICTDNCSMGLSLYKFNSIHNGECINCLKCIEICPRKNIKTNIFNKNINAVVVSLVAIVSFGVIYFANGMAGAAVNKNYISMEATVNTAQSKKSINKVKYKDGIYTGNSSMYVKPNVQVSVTIKDGKIVDIKVKQTEGTQGYYEKVINIIPNEIIKTQSTEVDVVSGASASSEGIIVSTQEALEKAKIK